MFSVLGGAGVAISVEMISQAAGGVSITFVVDEKDAEHAVKALHKEYIER
jgi:aspartokinase